MKILGILCIFALTCQFIHAAFLNDLKADLIPKLGVHSINDKFKAMLEHLKEIIKSGNEAHGIPVLDPFELPKQAFSIKDKIFNGTLDIKDFEFNGLSTYKVKNADFKVAKWNVSIDLLWPSVKGKTAYYANGHLLNKVLLYGAGDLEYEIKDIHFSTTTKLKVNFKTKQVSICLFDNTKISIGDLKLKMTGLFEDDGISEIASAVLSETIPGAIADFQEEITMKIDELLRENGNIFLKNYTIDDIIGKVY